MERFTYEITFTRLDGQSDEVQQYTDESLPENASDFSMSLTAQSFIAVSS